MTVRPERFTMVDFDAGVLSGVVTRVALLVGLPDRVEVEVDVDEASPFGGTSTVIDASRVHLDIVHLNIEGGAFEDPRRLRQFSEPGTALVLGRLLFRVADRLDPAFGDPPADRDLDMARHTVWDTYAVGRYARLAGVDGGMARRRYAFRLRHRFSDVADATFDRLWRATDLTWADLEAAGAEALAGCQ